MAGGVVADKRVCVCYVVGLLIVCFCAAGWNSGSARRMRVCGGLLEGWR